MKNKIVLSVLHKIKGSSLKSILYYLWLKFLIMVRRYDKCLDFLKKNIKEDSNNICILKGIMYYFTKDYLNAKITFENVQKSDKHNLIVKYFLAETHYMRSEIEKSELYYRYILSDSKFKAAGFHGLGCCYYKKSRFDEAIGLFSKALENSDKDLDKSDLLNKKGLCLIAQDKLENAKVYFEKSLEIRDNYAAKINLALVLSKLGDYKRAKILYEEILYEFPYDITVINNLALCIAVEGNYKSAISYYDKGLNIDPINADILSNKGYCLYKLGEYKNALECLCAAEKNLKDDPILQNNKALCLTAIEKYDEALKIFNNILQQKPSVDVFLNKAQCLIKRKCYKEALDCLDNVKCKNKKLDAYKLKGICYERLGQDRKAIECYNKSLNIA